MYVFIFILKNELKKETKDIHPPRKQRGRPLSCIAYLDGDFYARGGVLAGRSQRARSASAAQRAHRNRVDLGKIKLEKLRHTVHATRKRRSEFRM
jgi:hypothetical protein